MLVADNCFFKLHEYPIRCKIKLVVRSKTLAATSDGHGYRYHAIVLIMAFAACTVESPLLQHLEHRQIRMISATIPPITPPAIAPPEGELSEEESSSSS